MDRRARIIENMVESYGSAVSPEQAAAFRKVLQNHKGLLSDFNYLSNKAFQDERVMGKRGEGFKQLSDDINKLINKGPKPTTPAATAPVATPKPPIPRANPATTFGGIVDKFNKAVPKPTAAPTPAPRMGLRMPASGFRAPNVPGVSATKTVLNAPTSPKGFIKGGIGPKTLKGGLVETAIGIAVQPLIDAGSREAVRGAQVVMGQDTTRFDAKNAGRPVVENINGVSYNIATPEGLAGYQKAMRAGGKDTTPGKRTGSVDTPTEYPTEAVLETIKPSRDYQQEAGGGSEDRTNSEGVVQHGQTLGGVNKILKGFGADELADISTAYQSAALPATLAGVTQLEKPLVEGGNPTQKPDVSQPFQQDPQLKASFPEGKTPFASTDSYTPYSTGGNPNNSQDGVSPIPDRVGRLRQIAFSDDGTLASPTQSNPMRNQIRDIYGDTSLTIAQQSAKVSALTGVYRYGGEGYANVGGKLVPAKDGSGRSLLNARGAGLDPTKYLDIPETETPAYKPDVSGQSKSVQEAVNLTAPPTSLSTELDVAGPKVDTTEFMKSFKQKIGLAK